MAACSNVAVARFMGELPVVIYSIGVFVALVVTTHEHGVLAQGFMGSGILCLEFYMIQRHAAISTRTKPVREGEGAHCALTQKYTSNCLKP